MRLVLGIFLSQLGSVLPRLLRVRLSPIFRCPFQIISLDFVSVKLTAETVVVTFRVDRRTADLDIRDGLKRAAIRIRETSPDMEERVDDSIRALYHPFRGVVDRTHRSVEVCERYNVYSDWSAGLGSRISLSERWYADPYWGV